MIIHHCKITVAVCIAALYGCSDATTYNFENGLNEVQQQVADAAIAAAPKALFDPASSVLPFPNNLLFNGSEDGTVNIPLGDVSPDDLSSTLVSINALDGFSTTSPITMEVSSAVNAETVVLGQSVRVFEVVANENLAVTQVIAELDQTQVAVSLAGSTVAVVPVQPLKESTNYMVVATNAISNAAGVALAPSTSFDLVAGDIPLTGPAAPLEGVRQLTNAMLAAAGSQGIDPATVVSVWSFKTQSITPVMQALKYAATPQPMTIAPTGLNTNNINPALPGVADVYIGTLNVPYYRTAPANANDATGITSYWRGAQGGNLTAFNATPVATSVQTIPVLMSVPNVNSGNSAPPAGGWPIAIFVHGVTSDRSAMLAIADSMAQAGIAVIAIDQPMHGITDATNPLSAANTPFFDTERTFDIDLVNNDTSAPGPDGVIDSSGRHFYSPQFLLATRDNLRQSAADLMILSASIANINTVPINPARKTVIGHSLGGAAATPMMAFDDSISAASLGMPAAGLVMTTLSSEAFGPPIKAGLAASGAEEGSSAYEQFKVAAQTVVDSADAINFATMAAQNMPIHLIEVLGDTTVQNAIPGAPLAGTDAMIRLMGLTTAISDTSESAVVKFTKGNHSSLLLPTASPEATVEMQKQVATFAATAGSLIKITDYNVIQ